MVIVSTWGIYPQTNVSFNMKKFLFTILIALSLSFVVSSAIVHAQTLQDEINKQNKALSDDAGYGEPGDARLIAARLIKIFLSFLGTIFLIYTVYGGYLIMTAAGKDEDIEKGKGIIKYGVIGVGLILSSYSIVWMVFNVLYNAKQDRFQSFFQFYVEPNTSQWQNPDRLEQDTVPFRAY